MEIVKYRETTGEKLKHDLKYWCNSVGELHYHGERDITEDELPSELYRAYNELWYDGNGSLCYLVDYMEEYGIALVNEFSDIYAMDCDTTMEELYRRMEKKAVELSKIEEFEDAILLLGENTGDNCHEFIVILPWYTSRDLFNRVADILCEKVYL